MPSQIAQISGPARYTDPVQGDDERMAQNDPLVNYRYSTDPARSCGTCVHFQPPGGCELVTGMIRPVDVCDLWEGDGSGRRQPARAAFPGEHPDNAAGSAQADEGEEHSGGPVEEDPTKSGLHGGPIYHTRAQQDEAPPRVVRADPPNLIRAVYGPARAYFPGGQKDDGGAQHWRRPALAEFVPQRAAFVTRAALAPLRQAQAELVPLRQTRASFADEEEVAS